MTVAVEPLRDALLDEVRARAERLLAEADERAAAKLAEIEQRGEALVEQARTEGIAAAVTPGADERARANRRAQALVLAAKRELYEELRGQASAAAHALRREPGYAALLERLSATAREQLGEGTAVELDPSDAGGVRASNGVRHVDYTLDALVARCLERLGGKLEELWP